MTTNQLPISVQERIKADAEVATNNSADTLRDNGMEYSPMIMRLFGYKEGYIAGATAEHDRLNTIVDALKQFVSYHETGLLPDRFTYEKGMQALQQWSGEVEQPAGDKCRCIQPNWNAFPGKCLTCGKL